MFGCCPLHLTVSVLTICQLWREKETAYLIHMLIYSWLEINAKNKVVLNKIKAEYQEQLAIRVVVKWLTLAVTMCSLVISCGLSWLAMVGRKLHSNVTSVKVNATFNGLTR